MQKRAKQNFKPWSLGYFKANSRNSVSTINLPLAVSNLDGKTSTKDDMELEDIKKYKAKSSLSVPQGDFVNSNAEKSDLTRKLSVGPSLDRANSNHHQGTGRQSFSDTRRASRSNLQIPDSSLDWSHVGSRLKDLGIYF